MALVCAPELAYGLTAGPMWTAHFSIAFGSGDRVGPLLRGVAAGWIGGSQGVLWICSVLAGLAGLVALALNRAPRHDYRIGIERAYDEETT
ncbi:MAG: hypothetical protein ACI8PT_004474 [Gammaproteobacteria bacterium]|jgi:hypothetical protein